MTLASAGSKAGEAVLCGCTTRSLNPSLHVTHDDEGKYPAYGRAQTTRGRGARSEAPHKGPPVPPDLMRQDSNVWCFPARRSDLT